MMGVAEKKPAAAGTPRARALALSDWVRRHIRYVAVYIGPGGVVPHPAAMVLENGYGDCKDHAVLLEALLAASGIDSTSALINNGNAYRLPQVPTMGVLNHVINYLPSLDLYLDSTAGSVAAGYLPTGELGKPVLLAKSGALTRTPPSQAEKVRTIAAFAVQKDGSSHFTISRSTAGAVSEPYRQAVRDAKPADRDLFVQRMLQSFGQRGSGVLDPGQLDDPSDQYRMGLSGTSENFLNLPGPVGMGTVFHFWGGLGDTVAAFLQEKERSQEFVCPAVDMEDETGFAFPAGVNIMAVPRPTAVRGQDVEYHASYARLGPKIIVTRHFRFQHAGMTCTPDDFKRLQPALDQIMRDLKSQIIIKAG
jgi:hypothetical protein